MNKIIIIASRPGVGKSSLAYKIFQEKLKNNQKGFFFSLERHKEEIIKIVGKEYEDYILNDQQSLLDVLNFIKSKSIDFFILDYFQLFNQAEIDSFLEEVKNKNIDLYMLSQVRERISPNQEVKSWHIDTFLRNIADEVIFLYFQNNKLIKKILNKDQIKEEKI